MSIIKTTNGPEIAISSPIIKTNDNEKAAENHSMAELPCKSSAEWARYASELPWGTMCEEHWIKVAMDKAAESGVNEVWAFERLCLDLKDKLGLIDPFKVHRITRAAYSKKDRPQLPGTTTLNNQTPATRQQKHYYSPFIASALNNKQPDILAATVLYGIYLWQKNHFKQTLVDGKRYCFRSLAQLQDDMPYLKKGAIWKAIQRLEKHYGREFVVKRDKKCLWFSLGDKLRKQIAKEKLFGFIVDDAAEGGVREAVILGNLRHALDHFTKPLRDKKGNRYAPLSPSVLSPILGFSHDTISRCLKSLIKRKAIAAHPSQPGFYTISSDIGQNCAEEVGKQCSANVNTKTAEVNGDDAEVNPRYAEVDNIEGTDSNINSNEYCSEDIKDNIGFLPCEKNPGISSLGLAKLYSYAIDHLDKTRAIKAKAKKAMIHPDVLPYDFVSGKYDLPYDAINPNELTVKGWVDEQVGHVVDSWRHEGYKVNSKVKNVLRSMFACNLHLDGEAFLSLYFDLHRCIGGNGKHLQVRKSFDNEYFLKKARTPKAFLHYLPQIIAQVKGESKLVGNKFNCGSSPNQDHPKFDRFNFDWISNRRYSQITGPVPLVQNMVIGEDGHAKPEPGIEDRLRDLTAFMPGF